MHREHSVTAGAAAPRFRLKWKGVVSGPFTEGELRAKLRHGEVSLLHRVETETGWRPLSELLGNDKKNAAANKPRLAAPAAPAAEEEEPDTSPFTAPEPLPPLRGSSEDNFWVIGGPEDNFWFWDTPLGKIACHFLRRPRSSRRAERSAGGSAGGAAGGAAGEHSGHLSVIGYVLCGSTALLPVLLIAAVLVAFRLHLLGERTTAQVQLLLCAPFTALGAVLWYLLLQDW